MVGIAALVVGVAVVVEAAVVVTPVVAGVSAVVGTGSTISVLLLHAEANSTNTRTRPHDLIRHTASTLRANQQPCLNYEDAPGSRSLFLAAWNSSSAAWNPASSVTSS